MTIIVWDGTEMCSDRRMVINNSITTTRKIFRIETGIVGFSGSYNNGRMLLDWALDSFVPELYPDNFRSDEPADLLFVDNESKLWLYGSDTHIPVQLTAVKFAIGSGSDFARAALYLGNDARTAVEVTCRLDIYCGNGIDILTLESPLCKLP
jgi:ATP-dependent protease HslVU (ClpYQ) peptidase subunit